MLTLISGTNRPSSNTLKISRIYSAELDALGAKHLFFNLEELPPDFSVSYMNEFRTPGVNALLEKYIRAAERFVAVIPEYNGTFPGIFKLLIDALDPRIMQGKSIALVGVGTGRGGNARGMDQLTAVFHYLGMHVYPKHLPVSQLRKLVDTDGNVNDAVTLAAIRKHAEGFMEFSGGI